LAERRFPEKEIIISIELISLFHRKNWRESVSPMKTEEEKKEKKMIERDKTPQSNDVIKISGDQSRDYDVTV